MIFEPRFNDIESIIHSLFPPILRWAIMDVSWYMQAPAPLVLNSVLASISASAQGIADVEIYPGAKKPISLFLVAIAESGDRKTSIDEIFASPFKQYDREAIKKNQEQTAEWESNRQIWLSEKKKAHKSFDKDEISDKKLKEVIKSEPKKPLLKQIQLSDVTIEALVEKLSNHRLAYIKSSEGGALLKSRLTSNLAVLNTLWDGENYIKNRTGEGPIIIENPRVTLNLMVQPKTLEDFLNGKGYLARESGFLARCLLIKPKSMQGHRKYGVGSFSSERIDPVLNRIKSMLQRKTDHTNNNEIKSNLKLSDHHTDYINSFSDFIERNMAYENYFNDIKDAASKARENALRIAACLHLFIDETESKTIGLEALIIGCHLALYYLNEFKNTFSKSLIQYAMEDEQDLMQWILNRNQPHGVRVTEIQKYGPSRLRKKNTLTPILTRLWQQGRIQYTKIGYTLVINPIINQNQFPPLPQTNATPWLTNQPLGLAQSQRDFF